ncbi:MAG: CotH kinase family protein [Chitinophagales bacterium]|nr:CotH kinase family protein [Chitinophagales bacterium]
MKKAFFFLSFITLIQLGYSQNNPSPYSLLTAPYSFSSWNSEKGVGEYPSNILFLQYNIDEEPKENDEPNGLWKCVYNIDSRSRFVGLGEWGVGLINSSDQQDSPSRCGNGEEIGGKVGAVILALNTSNMQDIDLSWKVRMVEQGNGYPEPREFKFKAQYQIGVTGQWIDFPLSTVYSSKGKENGMFQNFSIVFPHELENKTNVQIRWKYFQESANQGGTRPFLALDDIRVAGLNTSTGYQPYVFIDSENLGDFGCLPGKSSLIDSILISAIQLTEPLTITSDNNFYISLSRDNNYTQTITLPALNGQIDDRYFYIKKECLSTGIENGKLSFKTNKFSKEVALKGEGYYQFFINEIVASNFMSYYDNFTKDYPDWIEVYNPNDTSLNLLNYYFSDDINNLKKQRIGINPTHTIPSKGFKLYIANGEAISHNHFNFSLSTHGETVFLVGKDGKTIIDSVTYDNLSTDVSYGRELDGTNNWVLFKKPTPNSSNLEGTVLLEKSEPPIFSQLGGEFDDGFLLSLTTNNPNAKIYYTTDGSTPSVENLGGFTYEYKQSYYREPGYIADSYYRPYRTNIFNAPINLNLYRNKLFWMGDINAIIFLSPFIPKKRQEPAIVIRAIAVEEGKDPSEIITHTFFYKENEIFKRDLPVISLTVNEDLFRGFENGISVPGIDYETFRYTYPYASNHKSPANYNRRGRGSEIPANFEIISSKSVVVNQQLGIRIHGNMSRSFVHKSLRLYPRQYYSSGKEVITYPIFSNLPYEDYKRLLLRNSGNDYNKTFFKDAFIQQIMAFSGIDYQEYMPFLTFINGEFFGLLNARERIDVNYFQRKYGFEDKEIDILENNSIVTEGNAEVYNSFLDNLKSINVNTEDAYHYCNENIDIDNYIDYNLAKLYSAETDWPGNNIMYWRYKREKYTPHSPYGLDGRWRWVNFDNDWSFLESPTINAFERTMNPIMIIINAEGEEEERDNPNTFLFRTIIQNERFKNEFITRYSDLLNTAFLPKRVNSLIDLFQIRLDGVINFHITRWEMPKTKQDWLNNIQLLRDFANSRPENCRKHIQETFGMGSLSEVTLDVDDINKGHIKINTIEINSSTPGIDSNQIYPWKGLYFNDFKISFIPIPADGYKFSYWETTDSISHIDTLVFDLKKNIKVKAFFEVDENYIYIPEAAKIDQCPYEFSEWASRQLIGARPNNMAFYYTRFPDSRANGMLEGRLDSIRYDYSTKTRINGLGSRGLSLINSTKANDNYYETRLGAVAVAFNTVNIPAAEVIFTAGTVLPQSKKYSLRLQYRYSDKGDVFDFKDVNGQLVEYHGNSNAEHEQVFKVDLPQDMMGRKYVQLLWRYYYNGQQIDMGSDARDELRIDDITIRQKAIVQIKTLDTYQSEIIGNPNSKTFQWYKCENDSLITLENETKSSIKINAPGTYALAVDFGDCQYLSDCTYLFVKEHKEFSPSISSNIVPNPNNGIFTLYFDEEINNVNIRVLDVLGKLIDSYSFQTTQSIAFDGRKWGKGMYVIEVSAMDGRKSTEKVIIH